MIRKLNTKFTFYTINTILILSFLYYFREPSLFFTLLVITGLFLLSTFFFSKQKEAFHIINYKKTLLVTIILLSLVISLGVNVSLQNSPVTSIKIIATGEKNPESQANQVWIAGIDPLIKKDGELSDNVIVDANWHLINNLPVAQSIFPATIEWTGHAEKVNITFLESKWSGVVKLIHNNVNENIDLYANVEKATIKSINIKGTTQIYFNKQLIINLYENKISPKNIVTFLVSLLISVYVLCFIFSLLLYFIIRFFRKLITSKSQLIFVITASFFSWIFLWILFYPGIMNADTFAQWDQIYKGNYDNHHPIVHTAYMAILLKIWESPAVISLFQIFFFTSILFYGIYTFKKIGTSNSSLILLVSFFLIVPVTGMQLILLNKDIPYSLFLMLLTIILINIIENKALLNNKYYLILLVVTLAAVATFRHNGILPAVVTVFALFIYYKKEKIMIPLKLLVGFIALLIILNPLLSSLLDAKPGEVSAKYYPMVHQIGAVVKEDPSSANEEQKQVLEKIMPFDYWVNKYYVYSVEQMVFNEEFEKNKNIFLDKTFSTQFIHVWLGLLKKHPYTVIKHVTAAASLTWQIEQPKTGYNYYHKTIDPNNYDIKQGTLLTDVKEKVLNLLEITEKREYSWFFWRAGFYALISIISVAVLSFSHKKYHYIILLLPVIFNLVSLFPIIPAQHLRYTFATNIITPILLLYALTKLKRNSQKN